MLLAVDSRKFNGLWNLSRWIYGLVPIILGLDKFFFLITDWKKYLNPILKDNIPLSVEHTFWIVGVIEIIAGMLVLSKLTRFGAYLVAIWIFLIICNLLFIGGYFDIVLRDIVILYSYIAYAWLTEIKLNSRQL